MSNDEGILKCRMSEEAARRNFGIRHFFPIRHCSPAMKNALRSRLLVLTLGALFALTSCRGPRLTKANVDQVSPGMSRKQVESILGPPTSIDSTNLLVMKKVTYAYT